MSFCKEQREDEQHAADGNPKADAGANGPTPVIEKRAVKALLTIVPIWAFGGMVSCEDQAAIEARVRNEVQDSAAIIRCQEPRVWHGEDSWICTSDLRGERTCYSLQDNGDYPAKVQCPSTIEHVPTWRAE